MLTMRDASHPTGHCRTTCRDYLDKHAAHARRQAVTSQPSAYRAAFSVTVGVAAGCFMPLFYAANPGKHVYDVVTGWSSVSLLRELMR